jgi:hypothetical protein
MIHNEVRALYSYWDGLRAGRTTPLRSEIDPRDMACRASNLFILENLGSGNVRFRLAGTSIVDAFGMELRGMNARAIMSAASRESFMALIGETLEDPGVGYARLRNADNPEELWEITLLPLRSDFGMIDRVIGCLHPVEFVGRSPSAAPLRFKIDHMSVEPIKTTVRELNLPSPIHEFAEGPAPFVHDTGADANGKKFFSLTTIDGGLANVERNNEVPREISRDHLRLIDD